MQALDRASAKV